MPAHLVDAAEEARLVIFAGAGISTENRRVFRDSFVEVIRSELKLAEASLAFPETMTAFCEQPDGRSRLLLKIRDRIDYAKGHPELYWVATWFHRELSTMWQLQEIITTNWDDFFERECGATPFITDKDLAFWTQPGRKVLKLHGSIHSLGEMVVTKADYERRHSQLSTGVLGSFLKTLLANRTVVFVGYSLADSDLQRILDVLTREMGELRPTYYIVTPEAMPSATSQWPDIRHIRTDGTHFLRQLKAALLKESSHTMPDETFERIPGMLTKIRVAHNTLFARRPLAQYPETLYCASYQDGLRHALARAMALQSTGQYSHRCALRRKVQRYEQVRLSHLRKKNYYEVAYSEGYMNGVILLAAEEDGSKYVPLYYVCGSVAQPRTFTAYRRLASQAQRLHATAFRQAARIAQKFHGLEVHHPPFLDTSVSDDRD